MSVPFPLFEQSKDFNNYNNHLNYNYKVNLTSDIGYLSNTFDAQIFLKYEIEGKEVKLTAPSLMYPEVYYKEDSNFENFRESFEESLRDFAIQFGEITGQNVDEKVLEVTVKEVVRFEKNLVDFIGSDNDEEDKNALFTSSMATSTDLIDIPLYLNTIAKYADQQTINNIASFVQPIVIKNPTKLQKLQKFLSQQNVDTIYNYIYFRVLKSFKNLFPRKPLNNVADEWPANGYGLRRKGFV